MYQLKHPFILAFAISLMVLAGCGWQLRGSSTSLSGTGAPYTPDSLQVEALSANSRMARTLRDVLISKNIELSNFAPLALVVEGENLDKRAMSVTETGVTAQYQLILTVRYHFQDNPMTQTSVAGERRELSSYRTYDFDAKLIVAKNQEEQALLEEMRRELANRILSDLPHPRNTQ